MNIDLIGIFFRNSKIAGREYSFGFLFYLVFLSFFIPLLRFLKSFSSKQLQPLERPQKIDRDMRARAAYIPKRRSVKGERENICRNRVAPRKKPEAIKRKRSFRNQFMGRLILNRIIKPIVPDSVTERVEVSPAESRNRAEQAIVRRTPQTIVRAPGIALERTLLKKCPCIRSLFGSRAKTKDGIPIVNMLISVI